MLCHSKRRRDTHTHTHTDRTLTHTNGSRLKGEVTLSSLQKLDTPQIQGFKFFFSPFMKAKINQPTVKILTHTKLLRMFSTFLVELQVHLIQSQIGQKATGN